MDVGSWFCGLGKVFSRRTVLVRILYRYLSFCRLDLQMDDFLGSVYAMLLLFRK